ncbi:cytochrome c oxidase assembly protein COX11, mitochondrial-like protein [Hyaloraphidium curvatum]|nr:cytochrome c oxidase assembly protein COX11, mitochondrial-like protein [Hyaloraphidium curvatum]
MHAFRACRGGAPLSALRAAAPPGARGLSSLGARPAARAPRSLLSQPPCRPALRPSRPPSLAFSRPLRTTPPTAQSRALPPHVHARLRERDVAIQSTMMYVVSAILFMSGLTYAAVPAYKLFCAATGIDGTPVIKEADYSALKPVAGARPIRISFTGNVSAQLGWHFAPQTAVLYVVPGETALAFFTATNRTHEDIVGVSTYSVVPAKAAQYFNKIQCFCFEEQKLLADETVDMPVFFYIDPEFADDPWMNDVTDITLSYSFFRSKGT